LPELKKEILLRMKMRLMKCLNDKTKIIYNNLG
jgi:hypothetical protein